MARWNIEDCWHRKQIILALAFVLFANIQHKRLRHQDEEHQMPVAHNVCFSLNTTCRAQEFCINRYSFSRKQTLGFNGVARLDA